MDPALAAVADVSPASITNGATAIPSTGATAAQVETDLTNLISAITTNRTALVLLMKPSVALALSRLRDATTGQRTFPNLGLAGGTALGVPVITSENVPDDAGPPQENIIVAIDASEVLFADGGTELDASENASIELNTTPAHPTAASSVITSLWQHDLIGIRAVRFVNWARRRAGSVALITGCQY